MMEPDSPISETLGQYLARISTDAQDLRAEVKHAEELRRKSNGIALGLMAVLALLMIAVLAVAWQNNAIANQARDTNARMADCTTPGGKCYTEGVKRTGSAIASILRAQIALGECSRLYPGESGPAFDAKLRACVYDRIQADPGPPVSAPATPSPSPSAGG